MTIAFTYIRTHHDIKVIAVDFDGTCVDHRYPQIGPDVPNAESTLKQLSDKGYKLILNTMRSGVKLEEAVDWFKKRGILLYGIQTNPEQKDWTESPKVYAQLYIDDAAFATPLIKPADFYRPCVDWEVIKHFFHLEN